MTNFLMERQGSPEFKWDLSKTGKPASQNICENESEEVKNLAECLTHLGDEPYQFAWYCERFLGKGSRLILKPAKSQENWDELSL